MEITISVPPKIEGILARKAAAKGQDIKEFIESLVESGFSYKTKVETRL